MVLTGFAGPAANLVMALVSGALLWLLGGVPIQSLNVVSLSFSNPFDVVKLLLFFFYQVNLVLAFFNLIPIPTFDGSRIWPLILSDRAMVVYAQIERYGLYILFGLLILVPQVIETYFSVTIDPLIRLVVRF